MSRSQPCYRDNFRAGTLRLCATVCLITCPLCLRANIHGYFRAQSASEVLWKVVKSLHIHTWSIRSGGSHPLTLTPTLRAKRVCLPSATGALWACFFQSPSDWQGKLKESWGWGRRLRSTQSMVQSAWDGSRLPYPCAGHTWVANWDSEDWETVYLRSEMMIHGEKKPESLACFAKIDLKNL